MSVEATELNLISDQLEETVRPNYRKASLIFIIMRFLIGGLLRLLFKIEVRGLENLPRRGGYILAGNHLSWLDPFLMLVVAPATPRIYFIGAQENMQTNRFRRFMTDQVGGVIPVNREQRQAYTQIAAKVKTVLDGGGVLGIFPEGTVSATETGQLLPFKKGIGYFAAHSGVPIVPVAFSGTKEPWLRKRVVMIIGEPIPGQTGGRDVAEQLTTQTARSIQAILPPPAPESKRGPKLMKNFFTNLFVSSPKKTGDGE